MSKEQCCWDVAFDGPLSVFPIDGPLSVFFLIEGGRASVFADSISVSCGILVG